MGTYEILTHPDPRLRQKATRVDGVGEHERLVAKKMLATMYESSGIGLAAVQVNIQKRIIVVDVSDDMTEPNFLFNPQVIDKQGIVEFQEGCLSVPGIYETVSRAEKIRYQYLNMDSKKVVGSAEGLLAICIQHEIDHLDGKLFVDYLSVLKQQRIVKKVKELKGIKPIRRSYKFNSNKL